jgi:predicted transcriptional regulator
VTAKEVVEILEARTVLNTENLDEINIKGACSADLMSDVLYYYAPDYLLITGLIKPQVIRTAVIAGIKVIVFTQNKRPDKDTIELAKQKNIPLLITPFSMYTASGKLYQAGLHGVQQ